MVMWDGHVASLVSVWSAHCVIGKLHPVPEVIIFSSPAPECIRKSINLFELLHCQATHTSKELIIRKHVGVLVEFDCKVSGHIRTAVVVPVVLHEMVDVMEDQTVPVQVFHSFLVAHVEQHGSVKRLGTILLYDIKGKLQSLLLKHWHQMSQENGQVFMSVPEGNQDCHLPARYTVFGLPEASKGHAWFHLQQGPFHVLQRNFTHIHLQPALHRGEPLRANLRGEVGEANGEVCSGRGIAVIEVEVIRIICAIDTVGSSHHLLQNLNPNAFHVLSDLDPSGLDHKHILIHDSRGGVDEI